MVTENGLYGTNNTIHKGYYSKQTTGKFKTVYSSPCSLYSNSQSSNT